MDIKSFRELSQALKNSEYEERQTIRNDVDIKGLIEGANTLEELNDGYDICESGGFNIEQSEIMAMLHEKTGKIASQLFEEKINNYEELSNWLETVLNNDNFKKVSYMVVDNLGEKIIACLNERISVEQDPTKRDRNIQICFDTFRKMQPFKEFLIRLNTGMNNIEGLEDVPNEYKEMDTLEKLNEAYKANAESEKDYVEKSQRMKQLNKMAKKLLLKYCNEVDSDEELLSWFGEILNGHKLESIDYTIINLLAEKIVSVADQKAKLAQDINEKDRYVQIRNKTLSRIEPYKANIIRMNLGLNNTAQIINEVAFEDGALGITRDYYRIRAAREEDTTTGLSQLIYPQDGLIRVTIENFNPLRNEYGKEIDEILSKETGAKRANIRPYCSEDTVAVLSKAGQPLVGFIREAKEYSQGNTTKIDFEKDYKSFLRRIQSPYSHKYQDNISSNQKEHDTRISNEFFERTSIPEYPVKEDNNSNIETLKEIFGEKELDPRGIVRAGIGKQKQTRS